MNILITSSSAKVLLVKSFKNITSQFGSKTLTADVSPNVATAFVSDKHLVLPRTYDKNFPNILGKYCVEENIGAIIPTRDGELSLMSGLKEIFFEKYGVVIVVPPKNIIDICMNKKNFSLFLKDNGFGYIPIVDKTDVVLPLFARPIIGSGSKGAHKIIDKDMLDNVGEDYILHPFINDNEYSVDLLMDLDGKRALQAVCRNRIKVISGESKISIVENIPDLERCVMKLGERLGLVGHNVIQSFYSKKNGISIIEANMRFGGASNLSIYAGLDSPRRIVQILMKDETAYNNNKIKYGMAMYRYSEDIFCETNCA